jgi:hypothetical protein
MPDPTITPAAADFLSLGDSVIIDGTLAARVRDYPIDTAAIRREMERLLSKPRCAAFVTEVIQRVAENAEPDNTLVEDGDVLRIFDRILQCQRTGRGRGVVRAGGPGSLQGGGNFAAGDMESNSAWIQIGTFSYFGPITVGDWKRKYLENDGQFSLHESMHHAGMLRYDDKAYAIAVNAMIPGARPLPTPDESTDAARWAADREYSRYWDRYLQETLR